MSRALVWTEEMDEWLVGNYGSFSNVYELAVHFYNRFGEHRNSGSIKSHCNKVLGITAERTYTKEQDEFLSEYAPLHSRQETTDAFNEKFNQSKSVECIKSRCNNVLGIKFRDNRVRWKSLLSDTMSKPEGSERISHGYTYVKYNGSYELKHRLIYEAYTGRKVAEENMVVFLDGDHTNFDPENLAEVSRAVNRRMGMLGGYTDRPNENTRTLIKIAELDQALSRKEQQ